MSHAWTHIERITQGKEAGVRGTMLIDHYAAGGEVLTASEVGLNRIDRVEPCGAPAGFTVSWDITNEKLVVNEGISDPIDDAEVAAIPIELKVFGRP